jgi:hypothetical protein
MRFPIFLALAVLLSGCLPSSGRKVPRGLFAADSLSSALGEQARVDTLAVRWSTTIPLGPTAEFVSGVSLAPTPEGRTVVIDTKSGTLHGIGSDGAYTGAFADGFGFPYPAGRRGDTLALLEREGPKLALVDVPTGRTLRRISLPDVQNTAAWLGDGALYLKSASEDDGARVQRFTLDGTPTATYTLTGPWWRHLGYLRPWGDELVSLSGYRPVVDRLAPDAPDGTTADSLYLMGFDSPQLERSRQFAVGAVDEPPLLSSAAVAVGPDLYVLNLRTGGLRIDVFGEDGQIVRALTAPDVGESRDRFLMDLDARRGADGTVELAVLQQQPEVRLTLYRVPAAQGSSGGLESK